MCSLVDVLERWCVSVVLKGPDVLRVPGAGELEELLGRLEGSDSALIDQVVVRGITGCPDVPGVSVVIGIVGLVELLCVSLVSGMIVISGVRGVFGEWIGLFGEAVAAIRARA